MSLDFTIDYTTGDMVIKADHSVAVSTGKDEVVQRVRTRLAKQLGEWRYNLASGIPWQDSTQSPGLLGSRTAQSAIRQYVVKTTTETDGVTGVNVVQVRFDTAAREYVIQIDIDTVYGNAIITI